MTYEDSNRRSPKAWLANRLDVYYRPPMPVALDGLSFLSHLEAAGIPPTWELVETRIGGWIRENRTDLLKLLYERGTGHMLLSRVVSYFYLSLLQLQPDADRLLLLQRLVTPELIDRMPQLERIFFAHAFIGFHVVETDDNQQYLQIKQFLSEIDLEPEDFGLRQPQPPHNGLRAYAMMNLINLEQEVELEEWLLKELEIPEDEANQVRARRSIWLTALETQVESVITEPDDDEHNKAQFKLSLDNDPLKALRYFEKLPIEVKMSYLTLIISALIEHQHASEAHQLLDKIHQSIQTTEDSPDTLKNRAEKLLEPFVLCADTEGTIWCMEHIDKKAFAKVCKSLGVSEEDFCKLLFFVYLMEISPISQIFYQMTDLFINIKKTPSQRERSNLYYKLLAARIYIMGEAGIKYPALDVYQKDVDLTIELACQYGIDGTKEKFLKWLMLASQCSPNAALIILRTISQHVTNDELDS